LSENANAIELALSELPQDMQQQINRMAATIENNVRARWVLKPIKEEVIFGRQEALELLYKLGRWMKKEEV